jgi:hypothetical protein
VSHPSTCVRVIVAALLGAAVTAQRGAAQVTSDRGASILLFGKVVAGASTDTLIELANVSDNRVDAYCVYVDGSAASWQATLDFRLGLGPQRPLHWSVARGRVPDNGEDQNDIPAAPAAFRGELLCVQVDVVGAPFSGDALVGQATVADLTGGDVAAYSAAGLRGADFFNDSDRFLCLGGEPSDNCLIGAEYTGCPAEWILNLPADGAVDAQLGAGSRLSSRLTVIPCSQNLPEGAPGTVDIDISVVNELAQRFSATTSVTCWADVALADLGGGVFTRATLGTDSAQARLRPADASGGFVLTLQTTRTSGGATPVASSAATTPHRQGAASVGDVIVLP